MESKVGTINPVVGTMEFKVGTIDSIVGTIELIVGTIKLIGKERKIKSGLNSLKRRKNNFQGLKPLPRYTCPLRNTLLSQIVTFTALPFQIMAGNSIGGLFRVTTFGESHGPMIGVVIDGCPAGLSIDVEFVQSELDRRKPGQSSITTQRRESDRVTFVSGIYEGKTTGAPISAYVLNENQKEKDYENLDPAQAGAFRPSHADYTYHIKYGTRDHHGGGRSSARETAARVIAGAVAKILLQKENIRVQAYVSKVGTLALNKDYTQLDLSLTEKNIVRCPDEIIANEMIALIDSVRKEGDTVGGIVSCVITGTPAGLGEPVFDRLNADLSKAMLSINAAKGFEIGGGFKMTDYKGSQMNDPFIKKDSRIVTSSNNSGGVQGGISNGMDIYFNVAFKPVSTIMKPQRTVNSLGEEVTLQMKGRHDPCVLPRAVPVVEAMAAITMADHFLRWKANKS